MNSSDTMSDIGFDPLAWLREDPTPTPPAAAPLPVSPPPPAAAPNRSVVAAAVPVRPAATATRWSGLQSIHLAGRLEVASVAELKQEMDRVLQSGGVVQLNGSGVERADAAALQLLLAFWRESEAVGVVVEWQSPSAALVNAATVIGMAGHLRL